MDVIIRKRVFFFIVVRESGFMILLGGREEKGMGFIIFRYIYM